MKHNKVITSAMAALVLCEGAALAQSFNYQNGDLLAAFRSGSSGQEVIVDLGSASSFQSLNPANVLNFANVGTALTSVFGSSLDGVYWSVFGSVNTSGSPLGPQNTIWVTTARGDINIANDPSSSSTYSGQGLVIAKMNAIANGATSTYATVLFNQIIDLPASLNIGGNPVSYTVGVGALGDFHGTWTQIENLTPTGFTTGITPSVSDLFEQNPGLANNGVLLGSFTLANNGALSFNPVPEPSTWAMIGTGMFSLLAIRRFRRN